MKYTSETTIFLPQQGLKKILDISSGEFYGKTINLYSLQGRGGNLTRISTQALIKLRARPVCTETEITAVIDSLSYRTALSKELWTKRDRGIIEQLKRGRVIDHGNIVQRLYQTDATHSAYSRFRHYDTALGFLAEEFAYLNKCSYEQAVDYIRNCAKAAHCIPA